MTTWRQNIFVIDNTTEMPHPEINVRCCKEEKISLPYVIPLCALLVACKDQDNIRICAT
jgi:hypothetical protein